MQPALNYSKLEPIACAICNQEFPRHFHTWEKLVNTHRRLNIIASRDHGKTTFFDKFYPIYKVISKPGIKILIASYSDNQVIKILSEIKHTFENNEMLKTLCARNEDDWSKTKLRFRNRSLIDTLTFGSSGRGGHYDLILVDDPVKDFGGMNPDDQESYYLKSLVPMCNPDGQIVNTGNFVYDNDLMERLERNPAYKTFLFPALDAKTGLSLWPERWPKEKLELREKEIGQFAFGREYLLHKIDPRLQFFKRSKLQYYQSIPEKLAKIISIDPALSLDGDNTALVVTGTDENKRTYLLDYSKLKTDDIKAIVQEIFRLVRFYQVPYAQIETIGFQQMLKHWIYEEMRKQDLHFGIEEIRTHKASKEARIMALQPKIEAGSLLFHPTKHEEVIQELLAFPRGLHDDLIDALSFQVGKWGSPEIQAFKAPKSSFEWWQQQVPTHGDDWRNSLNLT